MSTGNRHLVGLEVEHHDVGGPDRRGLRPRLGDCQEAAVRASRHALERARDGIDGRVHNARVVKSLEPTLDARALEAVKTWKFTPSTKDGKPVAVEMEIEVRYDLR